MYGFPQPDPDSLLCFYVPEVDSIRLTWRPSPEALWQSVYAARCSDGPWFLVADVPTDLTSCDLPCNERRLFYTVTANFVGTPPEGIRHYAMPAE